MSIEDDREHDDGRTWGYMAGDKFVPLPKQPMLLGLLGPPPFSIRLPSGEMRDVIHDPGEKAMRFDHEESAGTQRTGGAPRAT